MFGHLKLPAIIVLANMVLISRLFVTKLYPENTPGFYLGQKTSFCDRSNSRVVNDTFK
jgi:hypothetical protein